MNILDNPISLFDNAVILKISIGKPGSDLRLEQSQYQVDADKSRTAAKKKLLTTATEIKEAATELERARHNVRKLSVASPIGDGTRLLSIAAVPRSEQILDAAIERLETVHKPLIIEKYPLRIEEDRAALNGLFRESDYPPVTALVAKFYLDRMYLSFGAPPALAQVQESLLTREQDRIASKAMETAVNIPTELGMEFKDFVDRFVERIRATAAGDNTKFKGLLDGFTEYLSNLPLRNLTKDEMLAALAQKSEDIIGKVSPELLKENKRVRDYVEKELTGVQSELGTFLNLRPGRSFEAA